MFSIPCFRPGWRLKTSWNQSKKNQIKHSKYSSIVPHTIHFPSEAIIRRSYPWWQEDYSPTSWNLSTKLSTQDLVVWGFKKQQRRWWDYSNFTKVRTFLVSLKVSPIWGHSHLAPFCLPLRENTRALTWKNLSGLLKSAISTGRVERGW